jgi:DNA-binding LytR/AlgR family response regulator
LRLDPEIEIVSECGSSVEALAEIRSAKPDLVFLDVQMPECDGFDVLELLGQDLPLALVFVTAYDQYALRAFEAGTPFEAVRQCSIRSGPRSRPAKDRAWQRSAEKT